VRRRQPNQQQTHPDAQPENRSPCQAGPFSDGTRRVEEVVAVPGRVENDVIETEPVFVRQHDPGSGGRADELRRTDLGAAADRHQGALWGPTVNVSRANAKLFDGPSLAVGPATSTSVVWTGGFRFWQIYYSTTG